MWEACGKDVMGARAGLRGNTGSCHQEFHQLSPHLPPSPPIQEGEPGAVWFRMGSFGLVFRVE